MSRPQRIEFEDAYYHVMNRGARRCDIFDDDIDRRSFLDILGEASQRFSLEVHAYCLKCMGSDLFLFLFLASCMI